MMMSDQSPFFDISKSVFDLARSVTPPPPGVNPSPPNSDPEIIVTKIMAPPQKAREPMFPPASGFDIEEQEVEGILSPRPSPERKHLINFNRDVNERPICQLAPNANPSGLRRITEYQQQLPIPTGRWGSKERSQSPEHEQGEIRSPKIINLPPGSSMRSRSRSRSRSITPSPDDSHRSRRSRRSRSRSRSITPSPDDSHRSRRSRRSRSRSRSRTPSYSSSKDSQETEVVSKPKKAPPPPKISGSRGGYRGGGFFAGVPGIRGRGNGRGVRGKWVYSSNYRGGYRGRGSNKYKSYYYEDHRSRRSRSRSRSHSRSRSSSISPPSRSKSRHHSRSRSRSKERRSRSRSPSQSHPRDPRLRSSYGTSTVNPPIPTPSTFQNASATSSSTARPPPPPPPRLEKDVNVTTSTSTSATAGDASSETSVGSSVKDAIHSIFRRVLNDDFKPDENSARDKICQEWAVGNLKLVNFICSNDQRKMKKAHEDEMKAKNEELAEARKKLESFEADRKRFESQLHEAKGDSQASQLNREALEESLKLAEEKCKLLETTKEDLLRELSDLGESMQKSKKDAEELKTNLVKAQNEFIDLVNRADQLDKDVKRKEAEVEQKKTEIMNLTAKHQEDLKVFNDTKFRLKKCEGAYVHNIQKVSRLEAEIKALKDAQDERDKNIAELELKVKGTVSLESELASLKESHRKEIESIKKEYELKFHAERETTLLMKRQLSNAEDKLKCQGDNKGELLKLLERNEELERKLEEKDLQIEDLNTFKERFLLMANEFQNPNPHVKKENCSKSGSGGGGGSRNPSSKPGKEDLSESRWVQKKVVTMMGIMKSKKSKRDQQEPTSGSNGNGPKKQKISQDPPRDPRLASSNVNVP